MTNPLEKAEFWLGQRVFVTGHTGFKGRWLVAWLNKMGCLVTGFSIDEGCRHPKLNDPLPQDVTNLVGDVRDAGAVAAALDEAQPDVVFHLAAQPIVSLSYSDPIGTYSTNVMGTAAVLEAVRRARNAPRAVVIVTSDKCYENNEWVWAYRESDALGGSDPYSNSKACAEFVTESYKRSFFSAGQGTLVASVRAGNVIGPGDWSPARLVPDLVRGLADENPVKIRQPGSIRPWQHVLEPLAGYLSVATRLLQGEQSIASAWNFGPYHDDEQSVARVADLFCKAWGKPAFWFDGSRPDAPKEAGVLKIDSRKAQSILGWAPRFGLEQAIQLSAQGYRSLFDGMALEQVISAQIDVYAGASRQRSQQA